MCLIIHCPKGSDKKDNFIEEAIRKAAEFNKDGMGYVIKRENNSVFINKGFFDVNNFINTIKKENIGENDELTIHLRIGNKGEKSLKMCHPFVISNDDEEIDSFLKGNTDKPVLMHNGTMYRHAVTNSKKSDTYFFTKNIMTKKSVMNFLKEDPEVFDQVMQPHTALSRLVFVFPDETETILLGRWYDINGLKFSKNYHEEYFPKKVITFNNNYNSLNRSFQDYSGYYDDDNLFGELYSISNDSIVEIPILSETRPSFVNQFGTKYELYMGLYLPREEDFNDFVPDISNNNFTHAVLSVIKADYELGIYPKYEYYIESVSPSKVLVRCPSLAYHSIEINRDDFYRVFSVKFIGPYDQFYKEYYKLVRDIPVSKSFYKKLNKAINKSVENDYEYVVVYSNGRRYEIDMLIATDFLDNMEYELRVQQNPALLLF